MSFNQTAAANRVQIVSVQQVSLGIKHIEYQVPALDKTRRPTGLFRSEILEKTVYDPNIISDTQILNLGQQAAASGYQQAIASGRRQFTESAGGINFRVYIRNGIVVNFHPTN